jgi:multiple sugar transport system permease protein
MATTTGVTGPAVRQVPGLPEEVLGDGDSPVDPPRPDAPVPARPAGRTGRRARRGIVVAILVVVSVLFLYPFAWLLAASLKDRGQVFDNDLWPSELHWGNYLTVWDELPLGSWMLNSVGIAALAAVSVAVSSSLVAWGFAHFRFPGRKLLFGLVLATMMLPGAVTMIPVYLIWKELGLLGTWVPLFGANLFGSAFYIFLQRQFYLGLPRELSEAARIDGANQWTTYWRIVFPLSLPSFIIVLLFEFQASWNNLQAALIYLNAGSPEDFTAPLGIAYAMTKYSPTAGGQGDYQYVMVASLLVTLPMLALFAFGQRYFIEGVATTGRRG